MRRHVTAICCLALMLSASSLHAKPKLMSIQVDQREIRSGSTFFDKVVGKVDYGQRVEVLQEQKGWSKIKVEGTGLTGWIHSSALSKKKLKLKAGDKDVDSGASSEELALAGKGFDQETERNYRKENPKIDFSGVDKMEKMKVHTKTIQAFVEQGGAK